MRGLIMTAFILVFATAANAQCEPDLVNCVDINQPGEICPLQLKNGNVGSDYLEVITIITPDTVSVANTKIGIEKITLDSIHNLPPGLTFSGETLEFLPGMNYCVSISGIPMATGTFYLKIYVTPYIWLFNTLISVGSQVDSTSVSLTIEPSLGISSLQKDEFSLIHAYPNPFMTSTRIGYLEPSPGIAELRIMNMLGRVIYSERIMAERGENYFDFQGNELEPGYYIYAIIREQKSLKGKLLKRK